MAVVDKNGYPILNPWASGTSNVMTFTDIEKSQGIIFKSEIISNQVNGVLKDISNAVRWCQFNGAYYQANTTYDIGNQCAVIVKLKDFNQYVRINFYAINQVTNVPPLTADVSSVETPGGYLIYESDSLDVLKTKLSPGWAIDTYLIDYFTAKFKALEKALTDKVNEAIERTKDKWRNLGNVGGTWNFNLGDKANDGYNCFILALTSATNFNQFITTGIKDNKSGLIVIQNGGLNLKKFFTSTNVIHTIEVPIDPEPYNSSGGNNFLCFPYYFNPTTNKVYMTRV